MNKWWLNSKMKYVIGEEEVKKIANTAIANLDNFILAENEESSDSLFVSTNKVRMAEQAKKLVKILG